MQTVIPAGVNILSYLRSKGIFVPAYCSGGGTCGKCLVKVAAGSLDITFADRMKLTQKQLDEGLRLACKAYTKTPVRIELPDAGDITSPENQSDGKPDSSHSFGLALDIGTTTLAMSLVDIDIKRAVRTKTRRSHQSAYGADVITRIESSLSGAREELKGTVLGDISELIKSLDLKGLDVKKMTVSANTVMYSMLLGLDCKGLSAAPFEPPTLGGERLSAKELFGSSPIPDGIAPDMPVKLIRGTSAFVGGDIISGLCALDLDKTEQTVLFSDLGTNGESALVKGGEVLVTSASAGPALEGGELSCGMAGTEGAISRVYKKDGRMCLDVIGGGEAKGLCGSGAVDALAFMIDENIADSTGRLCEPYFDGGFELASGVYITQEDIRALQLAKSAIRASIEALNFKAGIAYEDIDRVYISGGFGYYLSAESAGKIGLLPKALAAAAQAKGNTSLLGAERALRDEEFISRTEELAARCETLALADDEGFKTDFLKYIDFSEE